MQARQDAMPQTRADLPVVHEDQPETGMPFREETPSPPRSQPLDELPPDMNSPRKHAESASGEVQPIGDLDGANSEHSKENSVAADVTEDTQPASEPQPAEDLDKQMFELLERQRSASSARPDMLMKPQRRKDRKLGRAPSGNNGGLSFTRPTRLEIADSVDTASQLSLNASNDRIPLPSQQLSYDAPGDEEHRRLMSRKLGTTFDDEGAGKRVGAIGTVRDAELTGTRSGGRVRGRHRDKETR